MAVFNRSLLLSKLGLVIRLKFSNFPLYLIIQREPKKAKAKAKWSAVFNAKHTLKIFEKRLVWHSVTSDLLLHVFTALGILGP